MSAENSEKENKKSSTDIIDLSLLENKSEILNSEYILSIIEICVNSHKYNLSHSNCTRVFWEEVMNNGNLFAVLKMFKAETLRKYWRIIRDLNQYDKMVAIVKEHAEQINNPCYKLLPIINMIADFIKSKEKNFDNYISGINKSKPKKKKEDEDTITFINNKRKPQEPIEDPDPKKKVVKKVIQLKPEETKEDNKDKDEKPSDSKDKLNDSQTESKWVHDNNDELSLEEIINTFNNHFTNTKREDIYQALYKTSGNIKDAYLFLCNPEKYESLTFVGTDDYIIQNLRNRPYYNQLLTKKGAEKVKERERFLNIKSDDNI